MIKPLMITDSPKTLRSCDQRKRVMSQDIGHNNFLNHRNSKRTIVVTRQDYRVMKEK